MRQGMVAGILIAVAALAAPWALAGEQPPPPPPEQPASPPPLPLHSIEGFSGVFLTETAYLANLPEGEGWFGKPSVAISGARINEKELFAATATMNFFRRVELGLSYMNLSLGDWDNNVEAAAEARISDGDVPLYTVGLRCLVLREGEFDTTWIPAVTVGARWKKNANIDNIDRDLHGVVTGLGLDDDDGLDFTVMASKTFAGVLPKPFILSAGLRATEAIQAGFLGFDDDYHVVFEGNAIFFILDNLVLAAEYRQMPRTMKRLGKLVRREDDWWSLALGWVVNSHMTVTAGFAHTGRVLDESDSFVPLCQLKWEF